MPSVANQVVYDHTPSPFTHSHTHRWEGRRTPHGREYFINHYTRTTQWEKPTRCVCVCLSALVSQALVSLEKPHSVCAVGSWVWKFVAHVTHTVSTTDLVMRVCIHHEALMLPPPPPPLSLPPHWVRGRVQTAQ